MTATRIHHATQARAAKYSVTIEAHEGEFRLVHMSSKGTSEHGYESPKAAMAALEAGEVKFLARRLKSGVMVKGYHDAYTANGGGCGDGLDRALRDALGSLAGDIDVTRLREIGEAHDVWNEAWENLNPGMQRMNLTNRLRARLRNEVEFQVDLDGKPSRYGVEYRPAQRKRRKAA